MTDPLYRIKPLEWSPLEVVAAHQREAFAAHIPNTEMHVIAFHDGTAAVVGDGGAAAYESLEAAKARVEWMYRESMLRHLEPTGGNP